MVYSSALLSVASLATVMVSGVAAHPHPKPGSLEAVKRAEFQAVARASLASCQDTLSKRGGVYDRARARREAWAKKARTSRSIAAEKPYKRSLDEVLATDHESDLSGVTNNTDASTLFSGNSSCVLQPEVTEGPYYVDGEYVRWDIREDQEGVDTYVDVQLIDVSTCEPVPNVYIDFWHANATGVYSGVSASGNGDGSDANLNTTFLRGLQETDDEGVAQWYTIFPGHYTGRATHIHIVAHNNGTLYSNETFKSDTVSHVGQIFFDQDLITAVEATEPYTNNTQTLTTNEEDDIMASEADTGADPVVEYVYLGDDVSEGIMAWVAIGINTTLSKTISAAASLYETGGVANENSTMSGGGPSNNSSMPSGSMMAPSGSMTMSLPSDLPSSFSSATASASTSASVSA